MDMRRFNPGFSLMEFIFAMAILALAIALAVPALSAAREAARAASVETRLLSSLTQARNRAAITGSHTVLCPSEDGATCADSPDWSSGWIGFLDRDQNREHGNDETLLLRESALEGKVRLRSSAGRTRIVFQGNGGNAGSNVSFTLCDGRGITHAKALVLSNQGRLRHATAAQEAVEAACAR